MLSINSNEDYGYCYVDWVDGKEFEFNDCIFKIDKWGNVYRKYQTETTLRFKYISLTIANGVTKVTLMANGKRKTIVLARLILQVHGGEEKSASYIAVHKDGDKDNHQIENLTWVHKSDFMKGLFNKGE